MILSVYAQGRIIIHLSWFSCTVNVLLSSVVASPFGPCIVNTYIVRFHVHTAASMKMTAVWDIASCSLVEVGRRFRGANCLHQGNRTDDGGSKRL
jgi:hypothetical protein